MKGGGGESEAPLKKKTGGWGCDGQARLTDRSLTAQLSLRRSVAVDQSAAPPRVTLGAIDGTFGVIGGDITPRRKRLGVTKS